MLHRNMPPNDLHDRPGDLLVVGGAEAPHPHRRVVVLVDGALGEGEPPGRHGGHDAHQEQVDALAAGG